MSSTSQSPERRQHIPVLQQEVVAALRPAEPDVNRLIDGTVGGGGHASALLSAGVEACLAMDRDRQALSRARQELAEFGERVHYHHGSYLEMRAAAKSLGWDAVDAILLDLGLSSLQLDDPERGFSFRFDTRLDMRFDPESDGPSAHDLINTLGADELAKILFSFGEERHARRIVNAIVKHRPIDTGAQLAEVVANAIPRSIGRKSKIHPATKTFQALRIAVNRELDAVSDVIFDAIDLLRPGGRLAVISFHSLEDRVVKNEFKDQSTAIVSPPGMASIEASSARVRLVNRKPIAPARAEIAANPRSRSAKLRVIEKL